MLHILSIVKTVNYATNPHLNPTELVQSLSWKYIEIFPTNFA